MFGYLERSPLVAIKLRSRRKNVEGISQISDMRFQITLTSEHVATFG